MINWTAKKLKKTRKIDIHKARRTAGRNERHHENATMLTATKLGLGEECNYILQQTDLHALLVAVCLSRPTIKLTE